MPKSPRNTRGRTRPLSVRHAESLERTKLLENRMTIDELRRQNRTIRNRLFGKPSP